MEKYRLEYLEIYQPALEIGEIVWAIVENFHTKTASTSS